jgi:hypothetical protein
MILFPENRTLRHMPKKKETPPESTEPVLVTAAKAIGAAAGKVASLAGAGVEKLTAKKGKLPKKNKPRLPRKAKKAQKSSRGKASRKA